MCLDRRVATFIIQKNLKRSELGKVLQVPGNLNTL